MTTEQSILNRLSQGPLSGDTISLDEWHACIALEVQGAITRVSEGPAVWVLSGESK